MAKDSVSDWKSPKLDWPLPTKSDVFSTPSPGFSAVDGSNDFSSRPTGVETAPKTVRRAERWLSLFLLGSLVFHSGLLILLMFLDRVPPMSDRLEATPVELIDAKELAKREQAALAGEAQGGGPQAASQSAQKAEAPAAKPAASQDPVKPVSEAQDPPKPASTKPEPPKPEPQPQEAKPDPPKPPPTPDKAETKAKPEPEKSEPAAEKPSKAEKPAPKNAGPAAKSAAKAEAKAALKAAEKKPASSGQSSPKAANGARLAYGDAAMPKQADSALQRAGIPYLGFDPDNFRAVALPMPTDTGSELVSYKEIVFGLLERAKHYPETAMERGARGSAIVGFTLDSAGKIVDLQLLQSSGEADLDVESLALVDRAAPFPLPPPGAQRSFSAEVRFGVEEIEP